MIDLVKIQVPIKKEFIIEFVDKLTGKITGAEFDIKIAHQYGCKLAAGEVEIGQGDTTTHRLYHPFESIPSSNGSLAFKIRTGGHNFFPFVELQASPAKLLQGHNAYGSTDFELCISSLLYIFNNTFENMSEILDYDQATVVGLDCTYSAHVESHFIAKQAIAALRHISTGQVRTSKHTFETSVLWNAGSKHCTREVYLKHFEILRQIEELEVKQKRSPTDYQARQLEQLKSAPVQAFAHNAIRFEAKCKKRMLERLGIPLRIIDLINYANDYNGDLAQALWHQAFDEIFSTFEGQDVNIYDDEQVLEKLKAAHFKQNKSGTISYAKAKRLFRFFRSIKNEGFEAVKDSTPKNTFYDNIRELTAVVPRAYLQNLHSITSNVVPLVRLINVDFSNQHPVGYHEPLHMSQQLTGNAQPLRLVG